MKDLCLSPDDLLPESADAVLIEEWQDFARGLISSCTGSKAYCSTLFGFVPIKDAKVAEKLAAEILLVTRDYPALFDLADEFAPFRKVMIETFCQMIGERRDLSASIKNSRTECFTHIVRLFSAYTFLYFISYNSSRLSILP